MTEYVTLWTISADLYVEMCDLCSNIYKGIINLKHKQRSSNFLCAIKPMIWN